MDVATRRSPIIMVPALTFLLSAWIAAALFYRDLPNALPTHWNVFLRADGYTAKPWGVVLLPLMMSVLWLGRGLLRHVAPFGRRGMVERFPGAFDFRMMLTVGVMFAFWTLSLARWLPLAEVLAVPAATAVLVAATYHALGRSGASRSLPRAR
ncbi:MAG TPA: DUF1648 domain-containing protein [Vicinamibacterales bacterium]|nr:DUF1648 domain-containing protein [Vicinamibacterales bacterium]